MDNIRDAMAGIVLLASGWTQAITNADIIEVVDEYAWLVSQYCEVKQITNEKCIDMYTNNIRVIKTQAQAECIWEKDSEERDCVLNKSSDMMYQDMSEKALEIRKKEEYERTHYRI